jgi:hypothetical protein
MQASPSTTPQFPLFDLRASISAYRCGSATFSLENNRNEHMKEFGRSEQSTIWGNQLDTNGLDSVSFNLTYRRYIDLNWYFFSPSPRSLCSCLSTTFILLVAFTG